MLERQKEKYFHHITCNNEYSSVILLSKVWILCNYGT